MSHLSQKDTSPKVAWLLQVAGDYWQPIMSEFSRLFPNTMVFTAKWPGFLKGFEDSFGVQQVGDIKVVSLSNSPAHKGYGKTWTYLSPVIVKYLIQFSPSVIFSTGFSIWTIAALALKVVKRWKVVIVYDGSSPSVDYSKSWLRLFIRRVMIHFTDAIITNSKAGKDYLLSVLGAKKETVFARPYLVPHLEAYKQQQECQENLVQNLQRPIFSYAGSIIPRKGVYELLQACVLLKNQGFTQYSLMLIGQGEQRSELEEFVQKHGLTEQVHWIGQVKYEHVGEFLETSDVFVFPTLEDVWGLVVVEAMMLGKPILCSKWAGVSELVIDRENGYVFDPHQPEDLTKLLIELIKQPELIESMGTRSKEIMESHSISNVSNSLAEVVEFVLNY